MKKLLECQHLSKKFGKKEILQDVSFSLYEGDILAFIGPNGSGKTTTIKLILGMQKIDKGKVILCGLDMQKDFVKAMEKVGAIVESPDMYMYLTGYQNLKLFARLYKNISDEKIMEIVRLVKLENNIHEKVSKYSLGMRQRLGIARSLINNPRVLILDEPTNGLDPEGIKDLREILKNLAKKNVGILISSHNLSELESFCNKVLIIKSGKVLEEKDLSSLKLKENKYIFKVNSTKDLKLDDAFDITSDSFKISGSKENIAKTIKKLSKENIDIYEVYAEKTTLEEAFFQAAGGNHD